MGTNRNWEVSEIMSATCFSSPTNPKTFEDFRSWPEVLNGMKQANHRKTSTTKVKVATSFNILEQPTHRCKVFWFRNTPRDMEKSPHTKDYVYGWALSRDERLCPLKGDVSLMEVFQSRSYTVSGISPNKMHPVWRCLAVVQLHHGHV